jgi:hypothetical protein
MRGSLVARNIDRGISTKQERAAVAWRNSMQEQQRSAKTAWKKPPGEIINEFVKDMGGLKRIKVAMAKLQRQRSREH